LQKEKTHSAIKAQRKIKPCSQQEKADMLEELSGKRTAA